jgi:leader peptidase (prepilin peptidase)/N-methyltransferase
MPIAVRVLLAACLGACLGSFLNVVLWRVPRGESIVHPPSHCPNCGHELSPLELVPVISWVALRRRCRHCGVRISARYPIVELAVAVLFAALAWLIVA